jgi:hypothetical protein
MPFSERITIRLDPDWLSITLLLGEHYQLLDKDGFG